jgi:hypothetical protein
MLRYTFGFAGGLAASDAGDINGIAHQYHVAANATVAAAIALKAGMDQELDPHGAFNSLPDALQLGLPLFFSSARTRAPILPGLVKGSAFVFPPRCFCSRAGGIELHVVSCAS